MTERGAVNNAVITPGIVVNNTLIPSQCAVRGTLGAHGPLSSSHLLSTFCTTETRKATQKGR